MSLRKLLFKLAVITEKKQNSVFSADVEDQKKYLSRFKEPADDIQRSFFQYKCQMKLYGKLLEILLDVASAPLALYYIVSSKRVAANREKTDVSVFLRDGKPLNILPAELNENVIADPETGKELSREDRAFMRKLIFKYPFSWHFILKTVIKISQYRKIINDHRPKTIIVCNEYSFTSSVLTEYCAVNGIKHINVMHGEKLFYIRDSFFRFHECYVWNEHYKELFCKLRADKDQFVISVPESLKFNTDNVEKEKDFTYYLAAENADQLDIIIKAMVALGQKGYRVSIRPHPRYSDVNEIRRLAPGIDIEDTGKITIEESVGRTENAVAVYSTVLNQAYNSGVGIVIDDISDTNKYSLLEKMDYIMLNKTHKLLSSLLEARK